MTVYEKIVQQSAKIETLIKEDLLIYYGCIDKRICPEQNSRMIDENDSATILEMLIEKPKPQKHESICVLIQSGGGKIAEAFKIASYLRHDYNQVNFVVMSAAASAASYLSLCGNNLYMRDNAVLSDFGPNNWLDGDEKTVEDIRDRFEKVQLIHSNFLDQLSKGIFRTDAKTLQKVIEDFGGPCLEGKQLNGLIHGSPILFEQMKKLNPSTIKSFHEIPAPGTDSHYASSSFSKINSLLIAALKEEKLAKLIVYNGKYAGQKFENLT